MKAKAHALAVRLNVARPVCDALVGHKHKPVHRMAVGAVVMSIGVYVAKTSHGVHYELLSMAIDGVGYAIHALGTTPFIEWLAERVKADERQHKDGL